MLASSKCDILDRAKALYHRGYIPLPLRDGGKHLDLAAMGYNPVHFRTRRKVLKELAFTGLCFHFSQKPPTESDIVSWFTAFSGNLGILSGHENLLVLDFDDVDHFPRWKSKYSGLLAKTPVARSPHGFHIYLKMSEPIVTSSMYSGFRRIGHIKSLGGYVVASPSVVGSGRYEWMAGHSPFDVEPEQFDSLNSLRLKPASPVKIGYDRIRKRGYFEMQ